MNPSRPWNRLAVARPLSGNQAAGTQQQISAAIEALAYFQALFIPLPAALEKEALHYFVPPGLPNLPGSLSLPVEAPHRRDVLHLLQTPHFHAAAPLCLLQRPPLQAHSTVPRPPSPWREPAPKATRCRLPH
eukprot:192984-Chlamydomonas_euryale.AAC.2